MNHFTVPVIRSPSRSLGWFAAMSNPTPAALINIRSRHHVPSHKAPRRTKDVHLRQNSAGSPLNLLSGGALCPVAEPDSPGEYGTPLAWGRGTHQSESGLCRCGVAPRGGSRREGAASERG